MRQNAVTAVTKFLFFVDFHPVVIRDGMGVTIYEQLMPRDGAIIFSDLIGKLDMLRSLCWRCREHVVFRSHIS